jgi:hypothetical protein
MSSNLVSSGMEGRALTLFALGGSGIRAIEPLLHLCALGLGPRQLQLVLIDPDQSNFAVTRSRQLIEAYRAARAAIGERSAPTGYFRTEVIDAVGRELVWSPIADDEHLPDARFSTRVDRALMKGRSGALGNLFDLLYSEPVRGMDLGMGFRGIPSIGTVFMNRLREQQFFSQILASAQMQPDMVFFSIGSVFGGTGSAAFPVIGRALIDGVKSEDGRGDVPGVAQRRIGGALLLPYFTLPAPATRDAPDGGPRPETSLFAQNAAAAIPMYTTGHTGYGSFYVLGDSQPREQEANEVGGERQANRPHYVELFSALAGLDFAAREGEPPNESLPVFRTTAVGDRNVGWGDLPLDVASRQRLMGGIVAAHTFLSVFRPDGGSRPALDRYLRGVTWMQQLGVKPAELRSRSAALDAVAAFFRQTWDWLAELRASDPALQIARTDSRRPTQVGPAELIEGRRDADQRRKGSDEFEVFRYWNHAAYRRRGEGFTSFLEVMREGSEAFAADRFSEATQVKPV